MFYKEFKWLQTHMIGFMISSSFRERTALKLTFHEFIFHEVLIPVTELELSPQENSSHYHFCNRIWVFAHHLLLCTSFTHFCSQVNPKNSQMTLLSISGFWQILLRVMISPKVISFNLVSYELVVMDKSWVPARSSLPHVRPWTFLFQLQIYVQMMRFTYQYVLPPLHNQWCIILIREIFFFFITLRRLNRLRGSIYK